MIKLDKLDTLVQKVSKQLEKFELLTPPVVRVGTAFDVSESQHWAYRDGTMQQTHDRLLAIAGKFDDNGELDTWSFDHRFNLLPTADAASFGRYVQDEIINGDGHKWGNTAYAPVMADIIRFYFGNQKKAGLAAPKKQSILGRLFGKATEEESTERFSDGDVNLPAWVLFETDGQTSDRRESEEAIIRSQDYPLYWSLVGVGDASKFDFLERMADKYPNVGFVNLSSLDITDEHLYDELITQEFVDWVKRPR